MNINKIEQLIIQDKDKHSKEFDSIDKLLTIYDPSIHSKYRSPYISILSFLLGCFSLYASFKLSFAIFDYIIKTFGDLAALLSFMVSLLFIVLFTVGISAFFYIFSNSILLKEKLEKAKNNIEEYKEISEYLIMPSFNGKYISESILNQLKIGLSTEDYQTIRLANKDGITYETLYTLIENEKEKEKIKEEQRNIFCDDQEILKKEIEVIK